MPAIALRRLLLSGTAVVVVLAPAAATVLPRLPADPVPAVAEHPSPGVGHGREGPQGQADDVDPTSYVGGPEVLRDGADADGSAGRISGHVFDDSNRDSVRQEHEEGLEGVAVSNGRDVVRTDHQGYWELPLAEGQTVFVTKPAGWDTPVDETNFARFHYHHEPEGTAQDLRFGGLAATGEAPDALNFPLARNEDSARRDQTCGFLGDVQTYSHQEIGFARTGLVRDLAARQDLEDCGLLLLGDLAGGDLGLYPRLKETLSGAGAPIRAVPGNHDYDIDSTDPEESFDTFKQHVGPENFSYDVGEMHVVGLNNLSYPCRPEENADGRHGQCADPENDPQYNGVLGEETLAWIEADLATVPEDKLVVVATHVPLVSYADSSSTMHQTDDVTELYALLEGREAISFSGHTHSVENMSAGTAVAGWLESTGVQELPFHHIVAGAPSGDWYIGDLDVDGVPMALQRDGAPPGWFSLDVQGTGYRENFHAIGRDGDRMGLAVNSPYWRDWYNTLAAWGEANLGNWDAVPPVNVNDLGDPGMVTAEDLRGGTRLSANVWNGTRETRVTMSVDGGEPLEAAHTQPGAGEEKAQGAEVADPYAATRQLMIARHAFESTSGNEDAQGFQAFYGIQAGPAAPRPGYHVARSTTHLWQLELPADLEPGVHTAEVTATDRHGRESTEWLTFEVVEERPQMSFRTEVFAG
ncbi:calcineurin-like phosphoesterase family protein [Kocuria sp. CPCC 205292]|uniref:calcineurin-like phosphoesterase C-terminal domain-containing protein n=1 Tax=Kocuria cellulosilytica TaxID=3071451 RepID=UPI0034D73BA5